MLLHNAGAEMKSEARTTLVRDTGKESFLFTVFAHFLFLLIITYDWIAKLKCTIPLDRLALFVTESVPIAQAQKERRASLTTT